MKITPELLRYINGSIEARGWSYADLAKRCGMNKSTFSRISHGETGTLAGKTVESLCRVLGVTEYDLMIQSDVKNYSVIKEDSSRYGDRVSNLAEWLRVQPSHVQEPIFRLATAYGWSK
jgi:transcriptional regulator with XRE-family HTH domain